MIKKYLLLLPVLAFTLLAGCQSTSQFNDPTVAIISAIESNLKADRLTLPEGNNAIEKIDQLAALSPQDPRIAKYTKKVASRLVTLGQRAFLDSNLYKAKQLAIRALDVDFHNPEAGYILAAVAEASRPAQLETESFQVETVEESAGIEILTVTIPNLDTVVTGSTE